MRNLKPFLLALFASVVALSPARSQQADVNEANNPLNPNVTLNTVHDARVRTG